MKNLHILWLTFLLTGCGLWQTKPPPEPEVRVVKEEVKLAIYQPPDPESIQLDDVAWVVITRENLSEKTREIEKITGNGFVIMAITPRDYENFSHNMQELKRYIRQQRAIILYYRDATKTSDDWNELNNKKIAEQRREFEASKN